MSPGFIVALVLVVLVVIVLTRTVRIIPQARAAIVERLGRYNRTLSPGPAIVLPFVDRIRPLIDLREQVVSFPPQPVITSDNLVVGIDTVIYFQVTDPKAATYEIASFIQGIEQLTVTTLRNVIGAMDLEDTLTSRDHINSQLRVVLDEATGKWGIRVNRVELKAIDPPRSIQEAMEKQMRADRDKRAAVLQAEGQKQSQILTAEGEKQSAILRAQGDREARVLQAEGQSKAIETVFAAIHAGDPDPKLLAYQYLQMLPQIAQGDSNKLWIVPSELGEALKGLGGMFGQVADSSPSPRRVTPPKVDTGPSEAVLEAERASAEASRAAAEAAPNGSSPLLLRAGADQSAAAAIEASSPGAPPAAPPGASAVRPPAAP